MPHAMNLIWRTIKYRCMSPEFWCRFLSSHSTSPHQTLYYQPKMPRVMMSARAQPRWHYHVPERSPPIINHPTLFARPSHSVPTLTVEIQEMIIDQVAIEDKWESSPLENRWALCTRIWMIWTKIPGVQGARELCRRLQELASAV